MALRPLQAQLPYGQYDGLDSEIGSLLGGEVVQFTSVSLTSSDKAAADVFDGYDNYSSKKRVAVTKTFTDGVRPVFLADEGDKGYGTMIGELVGTNVGKTTPGYGTRLGFHSSSGSGKVTLWNYRGLYAITLDAVDTNPNTGLQPTNTTLTSGAALYATAEGKLTPSLSDAAENYVIARFVEFQPSGGQVATPSWLVGGPRQFGEVVIMFDPGN